MSSETLLTELRGRGIGVEHPDGDTVILRHLPLRGFNKAATNLLLKRPAADRQFVALVDQDLEYLGSENSIKAAFAQPPVQGGWRPLAVEVSPELDVAIGRALRIIGFPWFPPRDPPARKPVPRSAPGRILSRFGRPISTDESHSTIGRQDQIEQILSCLRRRDPCLPLIVGPSGAGKTNLLLGLFRQWSRSSPAAMVNLDLIGFVSSIPAQERAKCFGELLNELIESEAVAAIEHIELACHEIYCGPLLLSQSLDRGARLIGTTTRNWLRHFKVDPLARRVHLMELTDLTQEELVAILLEKRRAYAVEIDALCATVAVRASIALPGEYPAKAISLLDAAVARAAVSGAKVLGPDDIYAAADRVRPVPDPVDSD
ncbi:MAG: hypothetical protein ABSC42_05710 [Tepidisphaeraceae bacterium]|jgi:ribose 1,5-bisphosphokinase PhnN